GNNLIEAAEVLQENHYYPFGMEMQGGWLAEPGVEQRYGYNGKELNEEVGWHDYGARWYDAAVGRWASVDPLAETISSYSTYSYTYNNPISFIDPTGMIGESVQDLVQQAWNDTPDGKTRSYNYNQVSDEPIYGEDGRLIAYRVEDGQGPTQIAKDLNENYGCQLSCEINYQDIVLDNASDFTNVIDANGNPLGKWSEAYKSGNISPGDILLIAYGSQSSEEITLILIKAVELQREIDSVSEIVARHHRINIGHEIFAEGLKWERGDRSSGAVGGQAAIALRMFDNVNDSVREDRVRSTLIRMRDSILNKIEE
ncbi:RHS repeat-associated core domain-containing protein, partial [Lewinella lacunae]